eukprot:scaffold5550_cov82-Cyclotella_meneghiniana.AAC.2
MADLFTPPKSKSNALRKACCCNWGHACSQLTTFFIQHKQHPMCGLAVVNYSDSCNFHNFLRAAINYMKIPKSVQDAWEQQYAKHKEDASKPPRVTIARHHLPLKNVSTFKDREISCM